MLGLEMAPGSAGLTGTCTPLQFRGCGSFPVRCFHLAAGACGPCDGPITGNSPITGDGPITGVCLRLTEPRRPEAQELPGKSRCCLLLAPQTLAPAARTDLGLSGNPGSVSGELWLGLGAGVQQGTSGWGWDLVPGGKVSGQAASGWVWLFPGSPPTWVP